MVIFISYEIFYNINKASVLDGLNSNQRPGISVQTCFFYKAVLAALLPFVYQQKKGEKRLPDEGVEIKTKFHKM